jgi:hypothetical protein
MSDHAGWARSARTWKPFRCVTSTIKEQHRIGLKRFVLIYDLDIPALIAMLMRKPYVSTLRRMLYGFSFQVYVSNYGSEFMELAPVSDGLPKSLRLLKDRMREILTEEILKTIVAKPIWKRRA